MGKDMDGAGTPERDDPAGEAIGTQRVEQTMEMGDATCSGRVTLYGWAV
ncbi:hypothetical protein [Actinomadura formosensis]|nr:hypothetical protein [Actinomadura formosensis]